MIISDPLIEYITVSPSGSSAVTWPMALVFSSTLKVELEINIGPPSLRSKISIVTSLVTVSMLSVSERVI